MEPIDRLNRAIHYIKKNLCDNVNYNEISKITLLPISAFQKFFCLTTGMTLSEYIRRRKLSCSADDLLHTNEKIIDIAVKYGYESADAFSVAFKRAYNISPSFARQTSALDPIAESELYEKYHELMKNKTSIYISHRLASTRFCDRILYMEDGRIIETGTHDELMKQDSKYAYLFNVQSHYYKEKEEA